MPRGFHRPDCAQNIGWHQLADGLFANPLIEQGNEPLFFLDIGRRVGILLGGEPFPSDNGEGQRLFTRRSLGFFLGGLFLSAGVNVVGKQFLGLIALAAGIFQGDGGIRAKAERLSFSGIAVIHPPQFSAGSGEIKVQAFRVGQFCRSTVGLQIPEHGVGQWHG